MTDDNAEVITLRRSTVVRVGIAIAILAALGIGIGIGFAAQSPSSPAKSAATSTTAHVSTTTTTTPPATTTTTAAPTTTTQIPGVVASCAGGGKVTTRPTFIFIGCATSNTTVDSIDWLSWGANSGQGNGTLNENNCQPYCAAGTFKNVPASIMVLDPVGGVFQTVTVTPSGGGLSPVSANEPGTGWGSD